MLVALVNGSGQRFQVTLEVIKDMCRFADVAVIKQKVREVRHESGRFHGGQQANVESLERGLNLWNNQVTSKR